MLSLKLWAAVVMTLWATATILDIRHSRDPQTLIINLVIAHGGQPYETQLDNLAHWFAQDQNRELAVQIAHECSDVAGTLPAERAARWSNSTEAKICKAAIIPASIGVLNHFRAEN